MINAAMKRTMTKTATLLAVASVAGTVGALAAAVPAQASSNDCSFKNNTIAIKRSDGTMLVPTVTAGGKQVGPDAVLFNHQDAPFTEFDKVRGTASGAIPSTGASFDISFNSSGGNEHYIGFITTRGGGTGWIQGSQPQISFTVPDGQISCSTIPTNDGGAKTATVLQATNIYPVAGGNGEPYKDAKGDPKFKPPGQVKLVAPDLCRTDNWCHVVGAPQIPQGEAWIYIGDDLGSYP